MNPASISRCYLTSDIRPPTSCPFCRRQWRRGAATRDALTGFHPCNPCQKALAFASTISDSRHQTPDSLVFPTSDFRPPTTGSSGFSRLNPRRMLVLIGRDVLRLALQVTQWIDTFQDALLAETVDGKLDRLTIG